MASLSVAVRMEFGVRATSDGGVKVAVLVTPGSPR
jgi:hypothetical protein